MATLQVFVKTLEGKTLQLHMSSEDTVADVKHRLHERLGYTPAQQLILRHGAPPLADDVALADAGARGMEVSFNMALRLRGHEGVLHASPRSSHGGARIWNDEVFPDLADSSLSAMCNGGRSRTGAALTVFLGVSEGPVQVVRHGNIPGPRKQAIEGTDGPVGRNGLCALWNSNADDVEAAALVIAYTDGTLKLCRREGGVAGGRYVASSLLSTKSEAELPTVLCAREGGASAVCVLGKDLIFVSSWGNFVDVWVRGASAVGASTTAAGASSEMENEEAACASIVRVGRFRVQERYTEISAMQFLADGRLACGCTNGAFTVWDLAAAVRVGSDEALTLEPVARLALPAGILELPLLADDVMGIFCMGTEEDAPGGCTLFEWRDNGSVGGCLRRRVGGLASVSSVRLTRDVRRVVATTPARHEPELLMWHDGEADAAAGRLEAAEAEREDVEAALSTPFDVQSWKERMSRLDRFLIALEDGTVVNGDQRGLFKLNFVTLFSRISGPAGAGHQSLSCLVTTAASQLHACALPYGAVLLADGRAVARACVVRDASVAGIVLATWSAQHDREHAAGASSAAAAAGATVSPAGAAQGGSAALLRTLGRLPRGAMAELYRQLRGV